MIKYFTGFPQLRLQTRIVTFKGIVFVVAMFIAYQAGFALTNAASSELGLYLQQ